MNGVTIIGMGRIGLAFKDALGASGVAPVTLTRGEAPRLRELPPGPIIVATRITDLAGLIPQVPAARRGDLVLLQNGDLPAVAQELGLGGVTLGCLWVAVPTRGAEPIPGRVSPFTGPHAASIAQALSVGGIDAAAVSERAFLGELATKLMWLSVVPVMAAVIGGTVGEAAEREAGAITEVVCELAPVAARRYGISVEGPAAAEVVLAYTRSIPHFPGGVKELPHRGGLFLRWASASGVELPGLRSLLVRAGVSPTEFS